MSLITLTTKRSSIVSCQEWPKTKCKCKPSSTVAKWACWSRHILQKHGTYFVCYCYSPSLFCWVYTGKDKPSVSCEIFLCVGITVFLLSVVSAFCFLCLMSSPQVFSTGCYTKHELAFGFFKCLVFIIRFILFSSTVGCRHIKDKWNHKRYAVTRWRNFY